MSNELKFMGYSLDVKEMRKHMFDGVIKQDVEYYPIYIDSIHCKLVVRQNESSIFEVAYTFDGCMQGKMYAHSLFELERKFRYDIYDQRVHDYVSVMTKAQIKRDICEYAGLET